MAKSTKKDLEEILRLSKLLGESLSAADLKALNDDAKVAKQYLSELKTEVNDIADGATDIAGNFRVIQDEINEGKKGLKAFNSSMTSFEGLSRKVQDIKKGTTSIDKKGLDQLKEQIRSEKDNLSSVLNTLAARQRELQEKVKSGDISRRELTQLDKINGALIEGEAIIKNQSGAIQELEASMEKVDNLESEINKKLGSAPGLLAGVDKIFQKLGFSGGVFSKTLEDTKKEVQESGKSTGIWGKYTTNLKANFKELASTANLMTLGIGFLIDGFITSDKLTGDLAKNMNVSYGEANKMRQEFGSIANNSNDIFVNSQNLQQSQMAINSAMGTSAMASEEMLTTMTKFSEKAGISHGEIMGIAKLSMANGKELENNTKEFLHQSKMASLKHGVVLNEKELMKDIENISAATQLSLGMSADELGRATATAKALGMNMQQLEGIANNLLDFESSIQNELEAELLTGKDLTLEKARQAALDNDLATLAEEINNQMGGAAEFGKMNRIQQDALAKSVGMNREELGKTLFVQEQLKGLTEEQAKDKEKHIERLLREGKSEEEIKNMSLEQMEAQASQQEKFNASVQKLQDIFVQVMDVLMPIFDILMSLAEVIMPPILMAFEGLSGLISGNLDGLSTTSKVLGTILATTMLLISTWKIYKGIQKAILIQKKAAAAAEQGAFIKSRAGAIVAIIKGAWSSLGIIPFIGAGLAIAAIAGGIGALMSQSSKGDDVMSPAPGGSGYGKRTLLGPEGAISLNNKDTVIAGTNLMGDDVVDPPGPGNTQLKKEGSIKGGGGGGVNMAPVVSAINALGAKIDALGNINVNIDGEKVASTVAGNKEFDRTMNNRTREVQ